MGEVNLGNLYDINKNIMQYEKPLKPFEIKDKIKKMIKYYDEYSFNYYMLLCREQYNFTLFTQTGCNYKLERSSFMTDLYECLTNRGEVLSIESAEGQAFEIWIKDEENIVVYYFFPYDNGVIEIEERIQ